MFRIDGGMKCTIWVFTAEFNAIDLISTSSAQDPCLHLELVQTNYSGSGQL